MLSEREKAIEDCIKIQCISCRKEVRLIVRHRMVNGKLRLSITDYRHKPTSGSYTIRCSAAHLHKAIEGGKLSLT